VICCQDCDSCFMIHQRRIAEEYLNPNFDEHCLDDLVPFLPGRAAARGLQPRAAVCHMVTTKLWGIVCRIFFHFPDLRRPQVGIFVTCAGSSVASRRLVDLRQVGKMGGKRKFSRSVVVTMWRAAARG